MIIINIKYIELFSKADKLKKYTLSEDRYVQIMGGIVIKLGYKNLKNL